ncbi:ABC transporter substrate-binding protein [soil metagenome]
MQIKFLPFLLLSILLSSCIKKDIPTTTEVILKDDIGENVKVKLPAKRILSMAPSTTEILFALGADSNIAAVTDFCDYPPEAKQKPKLGGYFDPNYEVMSSLKPDLAILTVDGKDKPSYLGVKNLGISIYVALPKNIEGACKNINDLGMLTLKEAKAKEITAKMLRQKDSLIRLNTGKEKINALIVIGAFPLMSANKNSFMTDVIDLSCLENIYKDELIDYPTISYEDVTMKDPEIIIVPCDTTDEKLMNKNLNELRAKLSTLKAVKNNNIFFVDANVLFRPGPRILDGAFLIRQKLLNRKS